jgi:AAA15 family ATPase/GTPase
MLIEFTVGNFLSFYTRRTLNFRAAAISDLDHTFEAGRYKLLPTAVVYGANSSGKSNLLRALGAMRGILLDSVKLNDGDPLDFMPFLLAENSVSEPTYFEIEFLIEDKKIRYGFEYNQTRIVSEWLYESTAKAEKPLFVRTEEGIGVADNFKEGKDKEEATNDNRLFVSLVAQLGGETCKKIIAWFQGCNLISGLTNQAYSKITMQMIQHRMHGFDDALQLFKKLQLGFNDIITRETTIVTDLMKNQVAEPFKDFVKGIDGKKFLLMKTLHNKYNSEGQIIDTVVFDKNNQESEGTKKIIDLSGPVFDTLLTGKVLIVDELDAKLHPLLTREIVNLFNSKETNPKHAQLLFATHDTNLLSADIFRRDQVWFTEKDEVEQTDLYNLVEFRLPDGSKVRNDSNLERNYIRGRYGAIPYIKAL